jgi:hypothetical protein
VYGYAVFEIGSEFCIFSEKICFFCRRNGDMSNGNNNSNPKKPDKTGINESQCPKIQGEISDILPQCEISDILPRHIGDILPP